VLTECDTPCCSHAAYDLPVPWRQVVLCANTPEEHQELQEAGCDAIYCNQNAWLDYHSIFTLQPSASPGCSCQGRHALQILTALRAPSC
jgi:hypothetical protein